MNICRRRRFLHSALPCPCTRLLGCTQTHRELRARGLPEGESIKGITAFGKSGGQLNYTDVDTPSNTLPYGSNQADVAFMERNNDLPTFHEEPDILPVGEWLRHR